MVTYLLIVITNGPQLGKSYLSPCVIIGLQINKKIIWSEIFLLGAALITTVGSKLVSQPGMLALAANVGHE